MSRFLFSLFVAAAVTGLCSSEAMAQRDAGSKARGEFGKGFWSSTNRGSSSAVNRGYYSSPQPANSVTNSQDYRSFSYEPVAINRGDSVVVDRDNVNMMLGNQSLGNVPKDTTFKVIQVTNGWLGAEIDMNGRKVKGWVWNKNVRSEAAEEAVPSAPAPPQADQG